MNSVLFNQCNTIRSKLDTYFQTNYINEEPPKYTTVLTPSVPVYSPTIPVYLPTTIISTIISTKMKRRRRRKKITPSEKLLPLAYS